jgi:ketosteroid isomerase-like protein
MWNLVTIRDGKITRTEAFTDPVSAVRASLER